MTYSLARLRRLFVHNVLHADDTPHRIALGVAVGVFIGITPTVGLQMFIAVAVAAALRANKAVCIPMVWITNPVTMGPIYAVCLAIGNALIGGPVEPLAAQRVASPIQQIQALGFARLLESQFWLDALSGLTRAAEQLWVGCLIVGFVLGVISYFVSRRAVDVYRRRREAREKARSERRRAQQRRFANRVRARENLV